MKWIMSLAAGLAIGYFVYQAAVSNKDGGRKTTGKKDGGCKTGRDGGMR